ncbi:MAG TPA: XrtA system polysaccharide chain length determinant [Dokdonella sp.]
MAGAMMPIGELAPILVKEARRRKLALGTLFAVIALAALAIGVLLPKKYESSTTILVQESNIVTGLMEGRAVATGVADRASIAREVIFSRKVMGEILATGGWLAQNPSPIDQDRMIEAIANRTKITSPRDNLIQITYADSDPTRAFRVTQRFAELFIQESLAAKERESRNAFEFIDSQVQAYHQKLTDAEDKLKAYRQANVDARPGGEADSNTRISQLRSQIEQARMELMEQRSRENALTSQLTGESEVTAVQTHAGQIRMQLAELQGQLDKLLLNYTDDYPDVVRIRHQMQDLRETLDREEKTRTAIASGTGKPIPNDDGAQYNPIYQDLRSKLNETRRNSAAVASRLSATERMLDDEMERSKRIANSENALAELTRDYEVNRDIYQDLLKRRENARVSMDLDEKQQGLTFRIQEPAAMPVRPSGLRLMHFALAGFGLGVALPLGLLLGYTRFDPRARSAAQIERVAGVPVLATIPVFETPANRRRNLIHGAILLAIIAGVVVAYVAMYWIRLEILP